MKYHKLLLLFNRASKQLEQLENYGCKKNLNNFLNFHEESIFQITLAFTSYCDKNPNFDVVGESVVDLEPIEKIQSKTGCIAGSILSGFRELIF